MTRVAVITGGAQGIGYGIAARLAEEGASVVLADMKTGVAKRAAEKINAAGGNAAAHPRRYRRRCRRGGPGEESRKPSWPLRDSRQQCRHRG